MEFVGQETQKAISNAVDDKLAFAFFYQSGLSSLEF